MIDPATPASVKVRAAEAIFNHAAKAIEIEDIEARVAELERRLKYKGPRERISEDSRPAIWEDGCEWKVAEED
jgi:hypothetical protein